MKRLVSSLAAFMLAVASVMTLGVPKVHATGSLLYWCGGTDNKFSTAANWNTVNDCTSGVQQAPVGGEQLVFDAVHISAGQVTNNYATLNNDIASLTLDTVAFINTSSPSNNYGYAISGNALSIATEVSTNGNGEFDVPVTFTSNAVIKMGGQLSFGNGSTPQTVTLGTNTLTINDDPTHLPSDCLIGTSFFGPIVGSGDIVDNSKYDVYLNADSPSYSGNITANVNSNGVGSRLHVNSANALGDTTGTTTINGGTILFGVGADTTLAAENLTLGSSGSATPVIWVDFPTYQASCAGGSSTGTYTLTLTGPLTLNADVQYFSQFATKVTGTYTTNGHSVTVQPGYSGTFSTSAGTVTAQPSTTTIASTDKTTDPLSIGYKQTYIIDGQRGSVTVNNGGTLMGSGMVGSLFVNTGGIVAPGHSPGCLSSGNLTLNGTYQVDIGGTTACTGYDQLKVTGTVDVTNGTLTATLYKGYVPKVGEAYTIIDNDGTDAVTGTFTGLAEGATYTNQGVTYKITYKGGDGNDVVLTVTAVNASLLPKTPNTGFQLLAANPAATASVSTLAAAAIFFLRRRMVQATAKSAKSSKASKRH